jgi:predicted ATPase
VVAPGASRLPLVGRDVEAARLQQALTDAWTGRGAPVVAVVGEAGVGKTRLLTALAAEAERRGGAVLLGRSYETEGNLPLGPWVSAVREAGVLTQRRALDRLDGATRAQLARVFPELLPAGAGAEAGESRDADRLFDALRGLLRCLALAQPLAVVLEDIHWADGMTVDCLAALARRWDGAPLLVAVSAREEELDPSTLRVVLDELHREQRLARQALAPLGHDDTVALIRGLGAAEPRLCVADAWTEAIWERSGGNPFIVMETVRAIADGGDLDLRERLPLPARVREMIGRHLAGLSGAARHLVGVAAVIGRQFDMDLLRRGAGLEARLTTDALEELIRRRVVHAVGNRFDFIHERVREVALAEVLPPRRQLLHAAVTAAMGARPGPDA